MSEEKRVAGGSAPGLTRRQFLGSSAAMAAAGGLALAPRTSVITSSASTGGPSGPLKIWYTQGLVPPKGVAKDPISTEMGKFAKLHPKIQLSIDTTSTQPAQLLTAVAGGHPPDIFWLDRYLMEEWVVRGVLTPLDSYVKKSKTFKKSQLWPGLLKDSIYKGKMYSMPGETEDRALFYNKALLAAAGLSGAPTTWDEWNHAISATFKTGPQGIQTLGYSADSSNPPGFLMWYVHFFQLGGEFLNSAKTKVTVNNEAGVGAMQYLLDQYDLQGGYDAVAKFAGGLNVTPQVDAFMLGKMAMEIHLTARPTNYQTYVPNLEWGVAQIPLPPKGTATNYNGGHAWVIPKGAKNPDAAWAAIEYLLTPASQKAMALGNGDLPVLESVAKSSAYLNAPPSGPIAQARQFFVKIYPTSKWVPIVPGVSQIFTIQQRVYDQVMRKQITPTVGMQQLQSQCQTVIDQWRSGQE